MDTKLKANVFIDKTEELYYLMNMDEPVILFNAIEDATSGFKIKEIYNKDILPYACKSDIENFSTWLRDRPIATNHEHINKVLDSVGISDREVIQLLKINNGFSLNDAYWLKPFNDDDSNNIKMSWKNNNLYTNSFDESLGIVTYFGNTSSLGGTLRTPEITNQGSVGKAWRSIEGDLKLYKKASSGASNLGKDHYSEVIATKILEIIGMEHVIYSLGNWHDKECSVCDIFTSESVGYLPMYQYLLGQGFGDRNKWTYDKIKGLMPNNHTKELIDDMIVFDFIIENWDRHFSNFGFLINNKNQELLKLAPIFDNGYSLMCRDLESDYQHRDYRKYTKTNTFRGVTNMAIAGVVIPNNINKYKHWAKEILININQLKIDEAPKWYMDGILDLITCRCNMILEIKKF
ncbi:MAG: hypothetical protein ACRC68_04650 [Clostridium sp.]